MMQVDEKFLQKCREIDTKYNELLRLINSVEVASDPRLFRHYQIEAFKLRELAQMYENYCSEMENFQIASELLSSEADITEKEKLSQNASCIKQNAEQIFECMQNVYVSMQPNSNEFCRAELVARPGSEEWLGEFCEIIQGILKSQNYQVHMENVMGKPTIIEFSGKNAYKNFEDFSGNIKKVKNGVEQQIKFLVFEKLENKPSIKDSDFKIETLKSSGAGGQHINKTESAVRVTHIPTGITAECQDERSQSKNKERAIENLKEKINKKFAENSENFEKLQRNSLKNAIFSEIPSLIFDYDANSLVVTKLKKSFKLQEVLNGKFNLVINCLKV